MLDQFRVRNSLDDDGGLYNIVFLIICLNRITFMKDTSRVVLRDKRNYRPDRSIDRSWRFAFRHRSFYRFASEYIYSSIGRAFIDFRCRKGRRASCHPREMLFTPLTRLVPLAGHRVPSVGPSDIPDMTDNTMALICRAVKRVKRCPRRYGADEWWLRAIQGPSPYLIGSPARVVRRSQAMLRQWFPLFHALPRRTHPHLMAIPLSLSLFHLPTYVPTSIACDLNRSIALDMPV